MRNTRYGLVFLIVFSVLTFGLSSPGNAVTGPTLTLQVYNGLTSLNPDTVNGNQPTNIQVDYLTRSGFFYVGQNGELIANTTFGTATVVSERPFKVRYTINKGRVWSDGVPITATDLLVHHISCSSKYASIANISGPSPSTSDAAFQNLCYGGYYDQRVLATPTVSSDKLSITVEYDKFFPEWAQASPMPFPAHTLVLLSEGKSVLPDLTKADALKSVFEKAVGSYDRNALLTYAKFWSFEYNLTSISAATNPLLLVSNGGYVVESAVAGKSVSLVYNEKYNSGPQVQGIARIELRVIADGTVAAQALANREIDILEAVPTADGVSSLRNLSNVKIYSYSSGPYEHLDLRVSAAKFGDGPYSGVFAGNSTRAQDLRRAFLLAFPRDQIVEKLIAPINPQAKPLNSLFYRSGESNYSDVVAKNGISAFTQGSQSVREAQALDIVKKYFPSASDTNPQVKVNLLWGTPTNTRRLALTQLAKASLARAGFDLNAPGVSTWSSQLSSSNYDAAIFAWARSDGSTERNLNYYSTEGGSNYMGYSESTLDTLLSTIQNTNLSENSLFNSFVTAEPLIYRNSWSLPLFEHPAAFAANSSLGNFKPGSNSMRAIWNYWELTLPGAKPFELFVASPTSTDNSSNNTATNASHQNGGVEVNWSPQVLGPKGSLEQKFVPMALGQVATNPPRWVGANNLDFCWEKLSQYGAGTSCGRIGWGFWSQSGDALIGNFDFALYDGVDFVTLNTTPGSTCARLGPSSNLSAANNITCWVGIRILPNNTYALKLFADTSYGDNWWRASLTNETTGEGFFLGRIKSLINDNDKKLASTVVRISYSGVPKGCDDVPTIDTYMTNLVINGTQSAYAGYKAGSCVKALVSPNELSQGGYALRMGGGNPEIRQLTGKNILVSAANTQPVSSKPTTPSFSGINFVGNKINLSVNIGSNAANLPDKVYLVAPKLGILTGKPLAGTIAGNIATWSLGFNKSLAGALIPFEITSEKNGVKSDPATASYQAPTVADAIASVPPTPSKFKSLIIGGSAVITAEVKIQAGALATNAYLVSKELGFSSARPLKGELAGSKIIVEIPIKASMAGKKYPVSIYVTNSKGKSKSLEGVVSIPKAPSTPKAPTTAPDQTKVNCKKGAQERLFDGSCPPGWEES
jgi:peptide/nickel transport system substrate-binding protein